MLWTWPRRLACLSLLCLSAQNSAYAAPTPGETDLIRERQDRLLEEQRRRLEELKELPGKEVKPTPPTAPADARCFPIKDIELKGADSLSESEKSRMLKPYIGQCLGVTQLNELLKAITDYYIEKGLVTSRAYLPQQDMSGGHLKVLVVEGKLEGLKGAEDSKLSDRELGMAFPGKTGELVNLREIEQMVDQMNRLPSIRRNLDNRGGVLASLQAAFTSNLIGVLKNGYDLNNNRRSGVTQAQRLNLTALAGIDNYGGRIAAQSGDATVVTGNFDNRNGGLYAKGKVNVTGNNFDNSSDNDGQIAGQQIDLNLSGALNNHLGIIESDSTLSIKAASLDNQTGQLRALGASGKTSFQIAGLFDNRNGTLESANSDLTMAVGGFLNGGGSLLHVGNGTFDISTANVTGAGGSIVTRVVNSLRFARLHRLDRDVLSC
ncbi:adhesin HecA-like repeat protein [Pseudomonas sp. SJZ080]|nr:adhesin HecA-like repeat protein [Pseudomonas sp. SJZ080]